MTIGGSETFQFNLPAILGYFSYISDYYTQPGDVLMCWIHLCISSSVPGNPHLSVRIGVPAWEHSRNRKSVATATELHFFQV